MKTYAVHITRTAQRDLSEAVGYIDNILKNPIAADSLLEEFEKKTAELAVFPEKYRLASDKTLSSWGIRFLTVGNYLAIYLIDEDADTVYIVRFLYGKSNWISILKGGISTS